MKTVILGGGLGTRLAEETEVKPKPMVEIGGRPIIWHIMKHYAHFNFNEFFIALGYKGEVIKKYFRDYVDVHNNITVRLGKKEIEHLDSSVEDWTVHLVDTGYDTATGGRIKRLERWLRDGTFMLTYGDGVSDVDINALLAFHRQAGKLATLTAVRPPARFGGVVFDGDLVANFTEKPQIGEGWINGGFMVLEPGIFKFLEGDQTILEAQTLEKLAKERQLAAYRHPGFWQCMDTLRDKRLLESLWQDQHAPWKLWAS